MKEIVKIKEVEVQIDNVNGMLVTTSNRVASELCVEHKNLIRKIDEYVEKFGSSKLRHEFYAESTYKNRGKEYRNYLITEKGIAQLIGGYSSAVSKAFELNVAYINKFEEMKKALQNKFKAPTSFKEALKLALEQQERIEELELQEKENKPKVLLAESISSSEDLILIRELAKIITQNGFKTGEQRLFSWLRENGFLIKKHGTDYNMPTQKAIEMGLFRVVERTVVNGKETKISKTTKVTGKGQQYFVNKFLKECK